MIDLAKSGVKNLRSTLAEWRSPVELKTVCDQIRHECDPKTIFNQGGLTFIFEAIAASEFGIKRAASRVRLVPEAELRPDFELDFNGEIERFEMVQADKENRRRGDEYKNQANLPPGTIIHMSPPSSDDIVEMVRVAARKKAKLYPPGTRLIIYLEASRFKSDEYLLGKSFTDAVCDARPFFDAIWVMWQGISNEIFPVA